MTDVPQAAAVAVVAAPSTPARSTMIAVVASIGAVLGSAVTIGGTVFMTGIWSGNVETRVTAIEKRLDVAEQNQRTYIPVLVGMRSDLTFLAERARRDDDRRDRELARIDR